jgi:hypothetical protein
MDVQALALPKLLSVQILFVQSQVQALYVREVQHNGVQLLLL